MVKVVILGYVFFTTIKDNFRKFKTLTLSQGTSAHQAFLKLHFRKNDFFPQVAKAISRNIHHDRNH